MPRQGTDQRWIRSVVLQNIGHGRTNSTHCAFLSGQTNDQLPGDGFVSRWKSVQSSNGREERERSDARRPSYAFSQRNRTMASFGLMELPWWNSMNSRCINPLRPSARNSPSPMLIIFIPNLSAKVRSPFALVNCSKRLVLALEDELQYKKICYFTNWAQYRLGPAKFEPEHIDPFLCTHIIYAFAYISNETFLITKVEENDEGLLTDDWSSFAQINDWITRVWWWLDLYRRINALKRRNPKLKTLLGVGGWNMMSYAFSTMVHDPTKRRQFIFDTIKCVMLDEMTRRNVQF